MKVDSKGYHILFFSVFRAVVLLRDNFTCLFCGHISHSNHVHHFDDNKLSDDLTQMGTLCLKCHNKARKGKIKFMPITKDLNGINVKRALNVALNRKVFY